MMAENADDKARDPLAIGFGPASALADPQVRATTAFLAGIGHVCLQWSLLELTVLSILYALKDVDHVEGDLLFGHLDLVPRLDMAIALLDHQRAPGQLVSRLKVIKEQLGRKGKIKERRNQAVHGAHADTDVLGTYNLLMSRWRGPKKVSAVSLEDLIKLTEDIHALRLQAYGVFEALWEWKLKGAG